MSLDGLILDEIRALAYDVAAINRRVGALIRGHNGLVRLIRTQGEDMSAVSDAILAEDAKTQALVQAVADLINKLNNGNNTLDAETIAALQTLDGHLNDITTEVDQAGGSLSGTGTEPSQGGPDAGAVGV